MDKTTSARSSLEEASWSTRVLLAIMAGAIIAVVMAAVKLVALGGAKNSQDLLLGVFALLTAVLLLVVLFPNATRRILKTTGIVGLWLGIPYLAGLMFGEQVVIPIEWVSTTLLVTILPIITWRRYLSLILAHQWSLDLRKYLPGFLDKHLLKILRDCVFVLGAWLVHRQIEMLNPGIAEVLKNFVLSLVLAKGVHLISERVREILPDLSIETIKKVYALIVLIASAWAYADGWWASHFLAISAVVLAGFLVWINLGNKEIEIWKHYHQAGLEIPYMFVLVGIIAGGVAYLLIQVVWNRLWFVVADGSQVPRLAVILPEGGKWLTAAPIVPIAFLFFAWGLANLGYKKALSHRASMITFGIVAAFFQLVVLVYVPQYYYLWIWLGLFVFAGFIAWNWGWRHMAIGVTTWAVMIGCMSSPVYGLDLMIYLLIMGGGITWLTWVASSLLKMSLKPKNASLIKYT